MENLDNTVRRTRQPMITVEEFQAALSDIINSFAQHRSAFKELSKKNEETFNDTLKNLQEEFDKMREDMDGGITMTKSEVNSKLDKYSKEVKSLCDETLRKMLEMKPKDGEPADEEYVISEVLSRIELPEYKETILDGPEEIKKKLESLKNDDRLDRSAIKGLEGKLVSNADLDRAISILDQRSQFLINRTVKHDSTLTGSGTDADPLRVVSSGSVTFYTETPSGLIDGINAAYTVSNTVTSIVSFAINGQYIHPQEYSVVGATITFNTPLDASYSGLNFTVVYV